MAHKLPLVSCDHAHYPASPPNVATSLKPIHLVVVFGAAFGISILAASSPRTWWARLLFSSLGPRLDADRMSRRQCLRSALGFFSIAALGLGATAGIVWFGDRVPGLEGQRLIGMMTVLYGVVGMTGLGAGLYLLTRAMLQPQLVSLRPPMEYLKEYVAADGLRRVRLTEGSDGSIVVTVHHAEVESRRAPPGRVIARAMTLAEAEALALEAAGYASRRRDGA
jgi:hypothetical protein